MLKKIGMLMTLAMVAQNAFPCVENGSKGFLPENNLYISTHAKRVGGLDQETFNKVIDSVEAIYAPIISSMGGTMNIERNWDDGTVNAYAQRNGDTWNIAMFGGLARHSTITPDGFALVVCHETGHHLGGAPKKASFFGNNWASNEGQADYFATLKCLRKVFLNDNNEEIMANVEVPEAVKNECANTFKDAKEALICQRAAMAGQSVSYLFAALRNISVPKFDTPDPAVVARTNDNHPEAQCRMDTYFAGAICHVSDADDVSQTDEKVATCHGANGDSKGLRPLCWFKPKN